MHATNFNASSLLKLTEVERQEIISQLTPEAAQALLYDWRFWAREKQIAPEGDWRTWLILAGRGFGKTRTGAELVREWAAGGAKRIALVGATAADVRDVMIEGESGILAISPPWDMPSYEPSKRRLMWKNGARATAYSADQPNRLRGPQHDKAWCDELAAWRYAEAYDMLQFGLRLGNNPQTVITTTPKPTRIIREIMNNLHTVVTTGTTYENVANLAKQFIDHIIRKYEGTRLGLQELYARLLEDTPGALWKRTQIDDLRVNRVPELRRIVVAIDPPKSSEEGASEAGIVVVGIADNEHCYVLDDVSIDRATPSAWARQAIAAYYKYAADRVIGESNAGGEMVESTVRAEDKLVSFKLVHASRGKTPRAEPVSSLYEQGKVHHVGTFGTLEDQMCTWVQGDDSPDRMDALVWAISELTDIGIPEPPRIETLDW